LSDTGSSFFAGGPRPAPKLATAAVSSSRRCALHSRLGPSIVASCIRRWTTSDRRRPDAITCPATGLFC